MSLLPTRGAGLGQVFRVPEFRAPRFAGLHAPSAAVCADEFPTVDVVEVRG